jgi:hypothetical protein
MGTLNPIIPGRVVWEVAEAAVEAGDVVAAQKPDSTTPDLDQ